jgi:flagellar protein FliO/FliZ
MNRPGRARWLAAAVAVAALALAAAAAVDPVAPDRIIVPARAAAPAAPAGAGGGVLTILAVSALAAAGVWLLVRARTGRGAGGVPRHLAVDETRSLGNRQYLVVASYREKKFLIGVCPGRIDLLAPLHDAAPAEKTRP